MPKEEKEVEEAHFGCPNAPRHQERPQGRHPQGKNQSRKQADPGLQILSWSLLFLSDGTTGKVFRCADSSNQQQESGSITEGSCWKMDGRPLQSTHT